MKAELATHFLPYCHSDFAPSMANRVFPLFAFFFPAILIFFVFILLQSSLLRIIHLGDKYSVAHGLIYEIHFWMPLILDASY